MTLSSTQITIQFNEGQKHARMLRHIQDLLGPKANIRGVSLSRFIYGTGGDFAISISTELETQMTR